MTKSWVAAKKYHHFHQSRRQLRFKWTVKSNSLSTGSLTMSSLIVTGDFDVAVVPNHSSGPGFVKVSPFGGDVTHHTELSCRGATCGRPHPLRGRLHALRGRPQLRRGRPLPLRFKPQPLRFTTAAAVCAAASSAWQAAVA